MAARSKVSVAEYLAAQIALSGKSQAEIAREVGYPRPNVINMIKQGAIKLPMNKVGPFAKSLGVDPMHLLRMTLTEYLPETWAALEQTMGRALITESEQRLLEVVRKAAGEREVRLDRELDRGLSERVRKAVRRAD